MFLHRKHLAIQLHCLLRRWRAGEGVAAVEFALIVPIMAIMFIGAVELSQAITVDRRVTQIASASADLVARWSKPNGAPNGILQSEVAEIVKIGGYIVAPYDKNPLQIVIRSVMSSPTSATNTKVAWSCTYKGLGSTLNCTCSNTAISIPANLLTTLDNVVISETTYDYKPLVFDHFMKRMGASAAGTYALAETIYLKPRNGQINLLQPDNTTPCPTPTF